MMKDSLASMERCAHTRLSAYLFYFALFLNLFLFLHTILNLLNNIDYTVTYFLSIPSTEFCARVRSELLNFFFVSPRVKFLYNSICIVCWQLLCSRRALSCVDYTKNLLSQTELISWVPC